MKQHELRSEAKFGRRKKESNNLWSWLKFV